MLALDGKIIDCGIKGAIRDAGLQIGFLSAGNGQTDGSDEETGKHQITDKRNGERR